MISFDDKFTKNFIGTGLFVEDQEVADKNYLKKIESKKILSQVEKAGLLSLAEKVSRLLAKHYWQCGAQRPVCVQACKAYTSPAPHRAERRGRRERTASKTDAMFLSWLVQPHDACSVGLPQTVAATLDEL